MLLLALLACHAECVAFEDMTVFDPDDLAGADMTTEIEAAIMDFAAWTGREGVCVPGVEIVADVPEDDPDNPKVGTYEGPHDRILVQADATLSTRDITVHELCHALDYDEDLEESWPEGAFTAGSVDPDLDYDSVDTRTHEAFARACAGGPTDLVVAAALDTQCGRLELTAADVYISTTVYPAYATTTFDPTPFTVTIDARPVDIDPRYAIYGAAGYDGEVLVLVDWYDPGLDGYRVGVLRLDPGTGSLLGRIDIRGLRPYASGVRMAVSDGRPVALVYAYGGDAETTMAYEIDPTAGTATNLGFAGLSRYVDAAADLDGVLYVAGRATGDGGGPELTAWDHTTGASTRLLADTWVWALQPSSAGLERGDMSGMYRLEADGLWIPLATRPSYFLGFLPTSANERLWFGGPDETPALLDMATHQWRLPADPCAVPPLVGIRALFTTDDGPFVLAASAADGTGTQLLQAVHIE